MSKSRNLDLSVRREELREKKIIQVKEFEIDEILAQFYENINGIKEHFNIAESLKNKNEIENCENIWRSQIVFLESALDYYIHCISKYGMIKMFKGDWPKTERYNNFKITLSEVEIAMKNEENSSEFLRLINDKYANDTFMNYDSIKSQLNLIGIDLGIIANEIYYVHGSTEKTNEKLKRIINKLFSRRNYIVHQFDRDHATGERKEISYEYVNESINDICKIVHTIYNHIKNKNVQ